MQRSQLFNMPKNAFLHCFHHQLLKSTLETQIKAYAVVASVQHAEKTRFCTVIIINFLKTALETQMKAYAVSANAQHAEKRVFAVFPSSIFEICLRNANKAICSSCKCSTC